METVRRGVFPGSNRLWKVTQRWFHTAWQELLGEQLQICPTVGSELTRDVVVGNLEMSREAACDAIERNEPGGVIQQSAQWDLWWIRQWENAQSNYRLQHLEEKDRERVDAVIKAFDPDHFHVAPQDIEAHHDARIVAETLVLGGQVLLTSNVESMRHDMINAWVEENRKRFGFATHEVLCKADETIERIAKRSTRGKEHLLKTVMGAFWPEDTEAEAGEALVEVQSAVRNLPAAHLPRVGEYCLDELREGRETQALLEAARQRLPVKMRMAERAHPQYPASRSAPEWDRQGRQVVRRLGEYQWRHPRGCHRMTVRDSTPVLEIEWEWNEGSEVKREGVGTAKDAKQFAEILVAAGLHREDEISLLERSVSQERERAIAHRPAGPDLERSDKLS